MTKYEFLAQLERALSALPVAEREDRLSFYGEMIDDRMEEGLTAEEAIAAIGSVDVVASQIIAEMPLTALVKEKIRPKRRLKGWEITLLIVGSPVWLSLLIAAAAVVLAIWVSLWAVVIALWACFAALVGSAVGGIVGGITLAATGYVPTGLALIAAALVCGGLGILMFFACRGVAKGLARLTALTVTAFKKSFVKKGESV
ncbi:MAG: DUF1700 domain-containing protein [Clostridia bacterium]|nr:DUF1700 domain-containing protein [Clostridia bacterium]MBR0447849.1 DUF1700 domain-containing protein [Clostridia bacterium]